MKTRTAFGAAFNPDFRAEYEMLIEQPDDVRFVPSEICPEFSGHPGYLQLSIADQPAGSGSDEDTYQAFEEMAADLETRLRFWLAAVGEAPRARILREV